MATIRVGPAMMHVLRLLQVLVSGALVGGFWLWWVLDHVGHGIRPESGFLRWWHELDGQPEFYLLLVQLAYPVYWWFSRNLPWTRFWRGWRTVHFVLVVILYAMTGLLWLATPDLGGHWG
jgi:hypothetical protein